MSFVLLTGATGLLGRYLLRDLFAAGHAVAVVARSSRNDSAADRMETVMSRWEQDAGRALPRPVVLEGELTQSGLGLSDADRNFVREQCGRVIHSAASLAFVEEENGEPQRTNLRGTENLLELCEETGVRELHHISTAYIAGKRTGRVLESELDVGQEFCNPYEESKCAAEKLVRQANIPSVTVYRPSIIVGDSQTGYTTTFHGFYSPFRVTHMMARKIDIRQNDLSVLLSALGLAGHECKNFVPVDWCSQALVRLFSDVKHHGPTYHLTTDAPLPVQNLLDAGREVLGNEFRPEEALSLRLEDLLPYFREQLKAYEQYWRHDPEFDRTNIEAALPDVPCPRIDLPLVQMLIQAAVDGNFGWPPEKKQPADERFARLFALNGFKQSSRTAQDSSQNEVGLQITGRGGGWWCGQIKNNELTAVRPGLPGAPAPRLRLTSATFEAVCRADLTAQAALETGRIVVLGETLPGETIVAVVESLAAAAHEHSPPATDARSSASTH